MVLVLFAADKMDSKAIEKSLEAVGNPRSLDVSASALRNNWYLHLCQQKKDIDMI